MGLDSLPQQNMQNAGLTGIDRLAYNAMFPQSQMDKTQYSVSSQLPTSAETVSSDYDAKTDAYTGLPSKPFKRGGLTGIPRYNGEEESQVQSWDPSSGQVQLQKLSNPNDPFSEAENVAYTIPKDQIKNFAPDTDPETGQPIGSGAYVLNDGSTLRVSANGVVQAATPGRNDYTLNKEGYYQPTGENLTWDGNISRLTKKIGGIDVEVPGLFTKGGYQDEKGNLRVDDNGVPVPLAPNYLDSGFGKSGLSDAAPYIAMAAMAAMGMPTEGMLFEGMVPASETLMGGLGAAGATGSSVPLSQITGSTFGGPAFQLGATEAATGAGAVGAGGAAAGGGGAAGAGGAAANTINGGNILRGALLANSLYNQLSGGARSGYSGQGLNPEAGGTGFNPGTVNPIGLPGTAGYEKTPWANLMPGITLSKLSEFGPKSTKEMAAGGMTDLGHLGGYSDGGRLLKGPGDGMSDNIPATIANKQPARLADGEFVIPADVVSHLGNGSTDAGAKQLYAMMDRIRKARTGNKKQGKQINPSKFLPKG